MDDSDVASAQALAGVASIAIVQLQATRDAAISEGRLQHALQRRITIEEAKSRVAERRRVEMTEAFHHNSRLFAPIRATATAA